MKVTILCEGGSREVEAEVFGKLCVNAHFADGAEVPGSFVITHIPTGRCISPAPVGTKERATFLAAELSKSPIWEFTDPDAAWTVADQARALWREAARQWDTCRNLSPAQEAQNSKDS